MEFSEGALAVESADPLANAVGHIAESDIENVRNRLAGILEDTFLEALLAAELVKQVDVWRRVLALAFLESISERSLKLVGEGTARQ